MRTTEQRDEQTLTIATALVLLAAPLVLLVAVVVPLAGWLGGGLPDDAAPAAFLGALGLGVVLAVRRLRRR